ncbi:MAG: GNAT family N-acetyltransferase [Solirubrobacteraceae bacterium]
MIVALDHVQVAAPGGCEEDARRFYGELLGLEELAKPAALRARGGAWFRCGKQQLHVGVQEPFAPAAKAHPALKVGSGAALEALAARLAAAGHRVAWEDDGARFHTDDPWGNRLELLARTRPAARALRDEERPWAAAVLLSRWGEEVLGGGTVHRPAELPAVVCELDGERIGLATWVALGDEAELVTVDALRVGAGAGGALVEAVADAARAARCRVLRVLTTNDNLPALRLYQRHGFALVALHPGAIEQARARKPSIPAAGHSGIRIRDELVLERGL